MNFRNINIIIKREYLTRVRKKSFLIITFLGPLFFILLSVAPSLILFLVKDKSKNIALIDESMIMTTYLKNNSMANFIEYKDISVDSLKLRMKSEDLDAILMISPLDSIQKTVKVSTYSAKPLDLDLLSNMESMINKGIEDYRIANYKISGLSEIMDKIKSDISITTYTINDSGKENLSSSTVYTVLSMVFGILLYMFVSMFSSMVMASVSEEKASRVVEVIMSSVKAVDMMMGKIVGVALVALTQFVLWIVLTFGIGAVAYGVLGKNTIAELTRDGSGITGVQNSGISANVNPEMTKILALDNSDNQEFSKVIQTLGQIDFTKLIIFFFIYFVFGYLLYSSMFAAVGASMENPAEGAVLQIPITIPLIIGFFIALTAVKSPDSVVAFWGSIIPFTSPIVMLARLPMGVPNWELALSVVLLIITFVIFTWFSAKIYQAGILIMGKKATWKDLWKWIIQK